VGIIKLGYMLKVLKGVLGRGTIPDPDAFKSKMRMMKRA
jgi:hypothetical protein